METMEARFIRYCKMNTRSDDQSETIPSTAQQVLFAKNLYQELIDLGFAEVTYLEDSGFVMASVLANTDQPVPTIGFIAHYDTADFNSENIQPQKIKDYQVTDLVLNENLGVVMRVADFPNLKNYRGHDLIVTDGTTLLGADDKAGIVEIIEAMLTLMKHPEIKHGK
ncbi:MAG TPA: peptidase T, partial [Erysipelothrix sp.]|nr:peptidase T [Erysipelothrix sp.]